MEYEGFRWAAGGLESGLTAQFDRRSGARGRAAEGTPIGVAETPAGDFNVRPGPLAVFAFLMVRQCVQAGQAGARR
ncbi:MAG TPA: hypothetical protein VFY42_01955 [Gemmatimonadales bacterium]|nr:hypothetical protein [Gemmatimonadales bacterium]